MLDFKRNWIFFLLLIFLFNLFFIIFFYNKILRKTNDYFTYPLDDTYIHLAMAKNFLNYKVIGLDGVFVSSTSSPLYTFIVSSLFLIFGNKPEIPLYLNIIVSFLILSYIYFNLMKSFKNPQAFLLSILFYFIIPIPIILFTGLEHLLHIFFMLIFINNSVYLLKSDKKPLFLSFLLPFLCVLIRYESLFVIFPFLILFLFKRKIKEFFLVFFGTSIPVIFYGLYSIIKGSYFLPNSLILKGFLFNFGSIKNIILNFGSKLYDDILTNIFLLPIFLLCLFILYYIEKTKDIFSSKINILSFSLLISLILHLYFAKTGWFYRYEAYLIGFSFLLFASYIKEKQIKIKASIISKISLLIIIFFCAMPLAIRSYYAFKDLPIASKNIYEQQIQMARFLQKYYKDVYVGINDIGAICYFKEKVLDIWGLKDKEILQLMIKKNYNLKNLKSIIEKKNVKILVVYEKIFEALGGIPEGFFLAGKWKIKDRKACAYDTVSFFAKKEELENLQGNLREYSFVIPKDVEQMGPYVLEQN